MTFASYINFYLKYGLVKKLRMRKIYMGVNC